MWLFGIGLPSDSQWLPAIFLRSCPASVCVSAEKPDKRALVYSVQI